MRINKYFPQFFTDNKNKIVYYFPKTKIAYLVKREDERKVNLFHNRLVLSIAFSAIIYSLSNNNLIYTLIAAIISYLVITLFFIKKLLPQYSLIKNYDIEANFPVYQELTDSKLLVVSLGYIIVSLLLISTLIYFENEKLTEAIVLFFSLLGLGTGVTELYKLLKRKIQVR